MAASNSVIDQKYFGMHIHKADSSTPWPSIPFGSWRLWDAGVSWKDLEKSKQQWDFSRLDKYAGISKITGVELLLPLGLSPTWASTRPNEKSAYQLGNAAEPLLMSDWNEYVEKVGNRYKGKIFNWEIWNEPNIKAHYSGSIDKLIELTCSAHKILKSIDKNNMIVSPSVTDGDNNIEYLNNFLKKGGKNCIDIVGFHFYVPSYGPEAMVPVIRKVREVMSKNNISHLPLWNTEFGWWIENEDDASYPDWISHGGWRLLDGNIESPSYILRALLLAKAEGVDRFYWYAWDSSGMGFFNTITKKNKNIVNYWIDAQKILLNSTIEKCVGTAATWSCRIKKSDGSSLNINWSDKSALTPRNGGIIKNDKSIEKVKILFN